MGLFRTKSVVDADAAAWHVENFTWLVQHFAGGGTFARTILVLPKASFFPTDGERGMDDWEVDLVEDNNALARDLPPSLVPRGPSRHALGTFSAAGKRVEISYVPALVRSPERLIATFAHELAHYLLATAGEAPVCADDERECLTDLAAVFMGFGVFLANARFHHETYSDGIMQGWRIGHSGYLPESGLIFALALFLQAKELGGNEAGACLKPHLASLLRRGMRQVQRQDIDRIREAIADAGVGRKAAKGH